MTYDESWSTEFALFGLNWEINWETDLAFAGTLNGWISALTPVPAMRADAVYQGGSGSNGLNRATASGCQSVAQCPDLRQNAKLNVCNTLKPNDRSRYDS